MQDVKDGPTEEGVREDLGYKNGYRNTLLSPRAYLGRNFWLA